MAGPDFVGQWLPALNLQPRSPELDGLLGLRLKAKVDSIWRHKPRKGPQTKTAKLEHPKALNIKLHRTLEVMKPTPIHKLKHQTLQYRLGALKEPFTKGVLKPSKADLNPLTHLLCIVKLLHNRTFK